MSRSIDKTEISNSTVYSVLLLFILITVFILPSSLKSISSIAFAVVLFIMMLAQKPKSLLATKLPTGLVVCLLVASLAVILSLAFSSWSKGTVLTVTSFLALTALLFGGELKLPSRKLAVERVFYVAVLAIIVFSVASGLGKTGAMYIQGAYDKNYFGIILFLFFCWCWTTRRKAGVVVCVASALFLGSRNYIIMLALFLVIVFIGRCRANKKVGCSSTVFACESERLRPRTIFFIFAFMFVAIAFFSFWWSDAMVGSLTVSYSEGFNDSSNAIRFNSDKYALMHLLEHPELLFYGYDNDIIKAMDIIDTSELDGTETALTGTFYNGYRIVQPHHVVLNMLLKEGVLFTVAYYASLSYILSRFLRRDNFAIWAPYFFGCMFMHSLLVGYYLVFLLLVLTRVDTARLERHPWERREGAPSVRECVFDDSRTRGRSHA